MRLVIATLAGLMILTGCAEVRYAGNHAQETTTREAQLSQSKLKYILDPDRRLVKEPPQPIKPAYCYKNFGDVVCYKDPIPNARSRMVGYQEPLVRATEHVDANGFEPVEYKDGDRNKVFNPYRNESGTVDAYVPKEQSFWRQFEKSGGDASRQTSAKTSSYVGKSAPRGGEIFTVESSEPVRVEEPTPVREFDMAEEKPLVCPESCKKEVKKAAKVKPKAMKSKKKVKAKAKKAAKKKATIKTGAIKEEKPASETASASAPVVAMPEQAKPAAETKVTETKPAEAPKATATASVRKLEEIKYDPKVADPKDLIKDKK